MKHCDVTGQTLHWLREIRTRGVRWILSVAFGCAACVV